jgi:glycine dehydrogenase
VAIARREIRCDVSAEKCKDAFGEFVPRHIGPFACADSNGNSDVERMVAYLGESSLDSLIDRVVPKQLRSTEPFVVSTFRQALSEQQALARLHDYMKANKPGRSYIGLGYCDCAVPGVIKRNILENPGWYTQYTPYQPEISQGRLEALVNYQTLVSELTGLPLANASLLDEGTAAAEAFSVVLAASRVKAEDALFIIDRNCYPQTIEVVKTRAEALGVRVEISDLDAITVSDKHVGVLIQYPCSDGAVRDPKTLIKSLKQAGVRVIVASDPLALVVLQSPGTLGADIAVGSMQRFGVPLGFGGPHAAYFACTDELKRLMPGRIVGVSKDSHGRPALRLSLQTREQHIRREKATSNICTAQVLLAVMSGMYAVYHGPTGLQKIASAVNRMARRFATSLERGGYQIRHHLFFDTLAVHTMGRTEEIYRCAEEQNVYLRRIDSDYIGITFDEAVTESDLNMLASIFKIGLSDSSTDLPHSLPTQLVRTGEFLEQEVFRKYHSETEFLRYVKRLEAKDLSLCTSMIPLGSCTMKLNATAEMEPVTWREVGGIHPFAPREATTGYREMFRDLEVALSEITGFAATSLQPNAGSQGEYAGLLVIRAFQATQGQAHRTICLIPQSAHGTNPASAVMAGLQVVVVACDERGNISLDSLREQVALYRDNLSCLMVTYPSTHGVFEEDIKRIASIVHEAGGQVYMDGANLNALVGLVKPADMGMDVCHINLHKTFCIPHGGGGPGMGPICVANHLAPFLPSHPLVPVGQNENLAIGPISAAPWGSASILPIPWMYMAMMGEDGLQAASKVAIVNANYIAKRLEPHFPVLYRGRSGFVAHECIVDLRELKKTAGVEVADVARRLMDYGFHAPTISWPVPGTMMIEPTESESQVELDRFCDALIFIREEIRKIEQGIYTRDDNPLVNAPHTALALAKEGWSHPYSREEAVFPAPWTKLSKFWPAVGKIDATYGDRNLVCSCVALEDYE